MIPITWLPASTYCPISLIPLCKASVASYRAFCLLFFALSRVALAFFFSSSVPSSKALLYAFCASRCASVTSLRDLKEIDIVSKGSRSETLSSIRSIASTSSLRLSGDKSFWDDIKSLRFAFNFFKVSVETLSRLPKTCSQFIFFLNCSASSLNISSFLISVRFSILRSIWAISLASPLVSAFLRASCNIEISSLNFFSMARRSSA